MSVGRPGRRRLLRAACGVAPGLLALDGRAQAFPARPIMLVVPFPPGGTTDILAREIAGVMQGRLGVPVVVQNVGGANHLSGELFKVMAGVDMMHVPYKGAAPALNDVMAGHVPVMFDGLAAVTPHLSGGKVRALAVTSLRRAPTAPQLPTIDESGVKGFEVLSWFGLYGAAQLPSAALARIAAEVAATMRSPEIEQRFARLGVTRGELSQPEFARFVDDEIDKWGRVIATARIPKQ